MRPRPPRLRPQCLSTSSSPFRIFGSSHCIRLSLPIRQAINPLQQTQSRGIRSIQGRNPRRSRFNHEPTRPHLTSSPAAAYQRKLDKDTLPLRTGVIATKRGMTALFDPVSGERRTATVLQMDRVQVVANKTRERHGYFAVCIGEGTRKPQNVGRAMMGMFAQSVVGDIVTVAKDREATRAQHQKEALATAREEQEKARQEEEDDEAAEKRWLAERNPAKKTIGLPPKREIREFRVKDESGLLPIGTNVTPNWFKVGQFVDTRSNTRGMGFAGVMKRWGMHGQDASHGVSLTHRSMGSAGGSQGSGSRVHPGKKMAGRMGNKRHTIQNLEVLMVDNENGLVLVGGPVSGPKGCLVMLQDAIKKPWPEVPAIEGTIAEKTA